MPKQKQEVETVSYGFEQVPVDAKIPKVRRVFDSVAHNYDLMNDLMSGGMHRLWKDRLVSGLVLKDGMKILDMAGGTGDIAFRILKKAKAQGISVDIIVADINEEMLKEGEKRARDKGIADDVSFQVINAEELPFEDNTFDLYTIAFGIRNVTHIDKVLEEANRALDFGGKFVCMEFSDVRQPTLKKIYDTYSFKVIPTVGHLVAKDREAYQYLVESIRMFPNAEMFKHMITKAGFVKAGYQKLTGGVVAIHSGWKA